MARWLAAIALALVSSGPITAAPAPTAASLPPGWSHPALDDLLSYVQSQGTTGFLIIQDGRTIVRRDWPVPASSAAFLRLVTHGQAPDGSLREDVASQQKSFVSVLVGVAIDRHLIDIEQPVSHYIGTGWSKATPEQEARITVHNLLEMNSGLDTHFAYEAPAGTRFRYNTEVFATLKTVLEKAAHQPLDAITAAWLTVPAGMTATGWAKRQQPGAVALNPTGLVTTPADVAKLGALVLGDGVVNGHRIVSSVQLHAMLRPSTTNPAYGRLWWLNGSAYTMRSTGRRTPGQLVPDAPRDMVAALGAMERELFVVPSMKLIVVRLGQQPAAKRFPDEVWKRLDQALPHTR